MKTKASEAARACLSRAATAGPFHCLQQVSYHMPSVDLPRQAHGSCVGKGGMAESHVPPLESRRCAARRPLKLRERVQT
jgi:hypothetical protein